ncbi:MAG: SMC-Scp complex subunit ScpB [Candidatus ainarchaeum sp.]|nr:SMC-Scp complex subunit ScpB [Candidatus ainarchaeum sp.]MDD5095967.1 SMC-Scp complex subunit ScpB [Candidatus ainarchaeum sp.]
MGDEKKLMEAALFISGRELSLNDFCKLTGIAAPGHVKSMLDELRADYENAGSPLEICQVGDKFVMRVRDQYVQRVKSFAQEAELSQGALRTLSYVASHDGALKSGLAKKIGPVIYDDVRELVEKGFLSAKREGRSSRLLLTDKFHAYFGK